jgi:hypothetical protein
LLDPELRKKNLQYIQEIRQMRRRGLAAGDVPRLLELLEPVVIQTPNPEVPRLPEGYSQEHAARALVRIGPPAVEGLLRAFRQGGPGRWKAFNILTPMGRLEGFDAFFSLGPSDKKEKYCCVRNLFPDAGAMTDIGGL